MSATIWDGLHFLQEAYESFQKMSITTRKTIVRRNAHIRRSVNSRKSLRDLYVDLLMHDGILRHLSTSYTTFKMVNATKKTIVRQIKRRENMQETIVPSNDVVKAISLFNDGKLKKFAEQIGEWSGDPARIKTLFENRDSKEDDWKMHILKHGIRSLQSGANWKNSVNLIECLYMI